MPLVSDSAITTHLSQHKQLLKKNQKQQDSTRQYTTLKILRSYFQELDYQPGATDNSFFQQYAIRVGRTLQDDNYLKINRFTYELGKDYFPLPQSGNGEVKSKLLDVNFGIVAPSMNYDDYKDFNDRELQDRAFLMRLSTPDGYNQQSPFIEFAGVETKTKEAVSRGASAVIFSNLDPNLAPPEFNVNTITDTFDIPVLYLKEKHYRKLEYDYNYKTILKVHLDDVLQHGRNFTAFQDGGADQTVVIVATYPLKDSLNQEDKDLYRNSRLPLLMEWAQQVKKDSLANSYNIVFALLPNDRTFQKGWQQFTHNIFVNNDSSKNYFLAVDMPSTFLQKTKPMNPNNTDSRWEETLAKTDSTIAFQGALNQGNRNKATAFYHEDGYNILHFTSNDTSSSLLKKTKAGINFFHQLNDTSIIPDTLQQQASIIHNLFIPDYNYTGKGVRIQNVRNKQLENNNITRGTIVRRLNDKAIQSFSDFLIRLNRFNKNESIILQLENQSDTFQIKIDHPFGTDTQH